MVLAKGLSVRGVIGRATVGGSLLLHPSLTDDMKGEGPRKRREKKKVMKESR